MPDHMGALGDTGVLPRVTLGSYHGWRHLVVPPRSLPRGRHQLVATGARPFAGQQLKLPWTTLVEACSGPAA